MKRISPTSPSASRFEKVGSGGVSGGERVCLTVTLRVQYDLPDERGVMV